MKNAAMPIDSFAVPFAAPFAPQPAIANASGSPRRRRPMAAAQRGFTLMELMITVAVIGILSAVALPAYTDYLRRGRLPEAFTYLSTYQVTLEQYYQDNRSYGSGTNCAPDSSGNSRVLTNPAGAKYFSFSCAPTNSGQGYLITASSGTVGGGLHTYTVDHTGSKATTYFKGSASTKTCWLVKGNEC